MIHKPILLNNLSLEFPYKTCFTDFSRTIPYGSRIAIIGKNGSGKTSLLQLIRKSLSDIKIGYVPQIIEQHSNLSGGQRFNKALSQVLSLEPDILILDEPTNHLDLDNRKSLMRMLNNFLGTLIIVSHDVELLRKCIDTFWHIESPKISVFTGNYDDYMRDIYQKRSSIEKELSRLEKQKKDVHQALMQEEQRAAKSKQKGQKSIDNKKWPTITSKAKALNAEETTGRKRQAIHHT
jgi:ATPase subunit of ABC transporter with duplicated ATPase domains